MDSDEERTAKPAKVSIDSRKLHQYSEADALKAFDDFIGPPSSWTSDLVRYRIQSDWQKDWRVEAGHWVLFARKHGFEAALQKRLNGARKAAPKDINDPAHVTLSSELAPVMVSHYLAGTHWTFGTWEPPRTEPNTDIDLTAVAPSGPEVAFQIKAPDKPGKWFTDEIHLPDGKVIKRQYIAEGEVDDWVRRALRSAAEQLPRKATRPQIIALCAQRQWPLGSSPSVIESTLLGTAINIDGLVRVDPDYIDQELAQNPSCGLRRGEFRDNWDHIGAVMTLDYRRGAVDFDYMCTVILNPWAQPAASCERSWFPHARVLTLRGDEFRWDPAVPDDSSYRVPVVYVPPKK